MPEEIDKTFSFKQKSLLYFYRTKQYLFALWLKLKQIFLAFIDTFWFYSILLCVSIFLIHKALVGQGVTFTPEQLSSFGFAVAGIIGASIAIIFSFSTFILQSTADLFSTQFLNKFIQDKKEKFIFFFLVILTVAAFLIPLFIKRLAAESLIAVLLAAFLLIFSLYKELRARINPETTLIKIRKDAFFQLEQINCEFIKLANIQNKIYQYTDENKKLSLAVQYKSNSNWNRQILENVKYLYEIGLRLLSKNEINSFNLTLKFIVDIYLKHLALRNEHIMRVPASFWGTYTFEDEGFTTRILEYLESISNRIIQDKRKENIYYLLNLYENLINITQYVKYADKHIGSQGENPILSLILSYYIGLTDKLNQSKETDWIWESIKSLSQVSNLLLKVDYNYFNYSQLTQAINGALVASISSKVPEAFMKEIAKIYFDQIKIGWNKYDNEAIFWKDLFKNIKKTTLALSLSGGINLSVSELYIDFHAWQAQVVNAIFDLKDKTKQNELKNQYINILERWSDFLLDMARDVGLEDKQLGLPIIQSVQNNIRIIYGLQGQFGVDLRKLYKTQLNTFSWYFIKTEKVDESFILNLEQIQDTVLREIDANLTNKVFDTQPIIDLYVQLVKNHFDKVSVGYGYNHPRVIEKLIYLGLILTKHNIETTEILTIIDDLNKKYLILNKEYFELKAKEPNLMGPDEYQLCKEIYDLENDLFSYNSSMRMDVKEFLSTEITKDIWDRFVGQIKYCEGITYKTVSHF